MIDVDDSESPYGRSGRAALAGALGIRLMISGQDSDGGLALVEHRLMPRALAAPMHRHAHEDEYSFVLEGRVGAKLGADIV
jgi:mannose-6-phosphate isomerase-like protein (cupin superfamily)